jgi:hypothetical protein
MMTEQTIWYVCPVCRHDVMMGYHNGVPICRRCLTKDGELVELEKKENQANAPNKSNH